MRIAEDDLCTNVDQLVDEEEPALKHLLMEEYASPRLRRRHQHHTDEVRRESRPGCVSNRQDGAVHKGVDLIVLLGRDKEVIPPHLGPYPEPLKGSRDHRHLLYVRIDDRQLRGGHGSHADEAPHLDHIRQDPVTRPAEMADSLDGQPIACDALDLSPHRDQQSAELLHVRLAGGIVDRRRPLRQHCCHDDIGGAGHRGLLQEHILPMETLLGTEGEELRILVVVKGGPQVDESLEVGIEASASDLISSRLGDRRLAEAREQRTYQQDRSPQLATLCEKLLRVGEVKIDVISLEAVGVLTLLRHFDAQIHHQTDEIHHVQDIRDVGDADLLVGEQSGGDDLESFVLSSLWDEGSPHLPTALYDKCTHDTYRLFFLFLLPPLFPRPRLLFFRLLLFPF